MRRGDGGWSTLMWSIAGVVTRHLEQARSFEVTFWRSVFTALCAAGDRCRCCKGRGGVCAACARRQRALWLSGLCWSVMFTAFMVALTLTTVANVLVTMAIGAVADRADRAHLHWATACRRAPGSRSWWPARASPGCMARRSSWGRMHSAIGTLVALCVPIAGAIQLDHVAALPGAWRVPSIWCRRCWSARCSLRWSRYRWLFRWRPRARSCLAGPAGPGSVGDSLRPVGAVRAGAEGARGFAAAPCWKWSSASRWPGSVPVRRPVPRC